MKRDADTCAATVETAKSTERYIDPSLGCITLEPCWEQYDRTVIRRPTTVARNRWMGARSTRCITPAAAPWSPREHIRWSFGAEPDIASMSTTMDIYGEAGLRWTSGSPKTSPCPLGQPESGSAGPNSGSAEELFSSRLLRGWRCGATEQLQPQTAHGSPLLATSSSVGPWSSAAAFVAATNSSTTATVSASRSSETTASAMVPLPVRTSEPERRHGLRDMLRSPLGPRRADVHPDQHLP